VASSALQEFLKIEEKRPLHARVAKDNVASLRVLEKCGFSVFGEDTGFAYGRGSEVEEFLLALQV
jgi:RimJ/RimL family protein N-acetyltransferase